MWDTRATTASFCFLFFLFFFYLIPSPSPLHQQHLAPELEHDFPKLPCFHKPLFWLVAQIHLLTDVFPHASGWVGAPPPVLQKSWPVKLKQSSERWLQVWVSEFHILRTFISPSFGVSQAWFSKEQGAYTMMNSNSNKKAAVLLELMFHLRSSTNV